MNINEKISEKKIVLKRSGNIDGDVITEMIEKTEEVLLEDGASKDPMKRFIKILIELLQNVYNYFRNNNNILKSSKIPFFINIGVKNGYYSISISNLINSDDLTKLTSRIDYLNTLNKNELSSLYKKQLFSGDLPENNKAGLGLILTALKSGEKIICKTSKAEQGLFYIEINVFVKK